MFHMHVDVIWFLKKQVKPQNPSKKIKKKKEKEVKPIITFQKLLIMNALTLLLTN